MARWARAGARVELLTVLALDPTSVAPTAGWDRRAGFATEGEAARARREEDRRACALLGVTPSWLPFGSVDFDRHGDEADVRRKVADALGEAKLVLLPGFPLSHPDHEWLVRTLVSDLKSDTKLALYAEQPYTVRADEEPGMLSWVSEVLVAQAVFERVAVGAGDRVAKWRAIRAYTSQLPLLGMTGDVRRGPLRLALADERVAWPHQ